MVYNIATVMQKRSIQKIRKSNLLKIGDLAKLFSVLPSTINYYTREGLLKADGYSQGGYRLYHPDKAINTLKKIERLQLKDRLTIEEIKKRL